MLRPKNLSINLYEIILPSKIILKHYIYLLFISRYKSVTD